jgi:hypothetical protein
VTDIVTRLRRWTHAVDAAPASDLMDEAADEIERLLRIINRAAGDLSRLQGENLRLRSLCGLAANQPIPEIMS